MEEILGFQTIQLCAVHKFKFVSFVEYNRQVK